jgi:hypothetical protein
MIKWQSLFFGERSLTKVAGLFGSRNGADGAARALLGASALQPGQVMVLGPQDGLASRDAVLEQAVEPEQRGIWLSIIRGHVMMGLLGMVAGVVLFVALMAYGHPAVSSTPGMAFVAFVGFGITFGLILGGVLSLRPDQGRVMTLVRRGLLNGHWAVVAHPLNARQTAQAMTSLRAGSLRVLRSF